MQYQLRSCVRSGVLQSYAELLSMLIYFGCVYLWFGKALVIITLHSQCGRVVM